MNKKEESVYNYLNAWGFRPKLKGYHYLLVGILITMEHPNFNCQDIFSEVAKREHLDYDWDNIYKSCCYCISQSNKKGNSIFSFLREAADKVRSENSYIFKKKHNA